MDAGSGSVVGQETEVARLTRERDEALLRETANSEILRLISKSPGDLELVFRTILEDATRICDAKFGTLSRFDGKMFNFAADVGSTPEFVEFERRRGPFQPTPGSHLERVMRTKRVSHTADYAAEGVASPPVTLGGVRSTVVVPMLKDNELIGVLSIYRQEVRPFTNKQIELLQNFAAQAVIAIENARLLNELRGRTQELTEALEQRTATSEVLGVISSAPGELASVFDTILANALRLCEADMGHVVRAEAGALSITAVRGVRPEYAQFWRERGPWRPAPDSAPAQAMEQKKPVQIADMSQTSSYAAGGQTTVAAVKLGGLRTTLLVPMVTDEKAIGFIVIYRNVVRPFSDKQIALVENFAKQAVIAIENARLLNELRERNARTGGPLAGNRQAQSATRTARGRSSWRNRAHGSVAALPTPASGRPDRRVGNGEAAREPSPGDNCSILRFARLYRLLGKLGPGRRYGAAARVSRCHRQNHNQVQRYAGTVCRRWRHGHFQ